MLLAISALSSCSKTGDSDATVAESSPPKVSERDELQALVVRAIQKEPVTKEELIPLIEGKSWEELEAVFNEVRDTAHSIPDKWAIADAFGLLRGAYTSNLLKQSTIRREDAERRLDESRKDLERTLQGIVDKELERRQSN